MMGQVLWEEESEVTTKDFTDALLDISEKIGSINAQLMQSTDERRRLIDGQKETHEKLREMFPVVDEVKSLSKQVSELQTLKTRFAAYIWLGGTFVSGTIALLWSGLYFFGTEIKSRLFH